MHTCRPVSITTCISHYRKLEARTDLKQCACTGSNYSQCDPTLFLSQLLPDIFSATYPAKGHNPNLHLPHVPKPNPLFHFPKIQKYLLCLTQKDPLLCHLLRTRINTPPKKTNCVPHLLTPKLLVNIRNNQKPFQYFNHKNLLFHHLLSGIFKISPAKGNGCIPNLYIPTSNLMLL